MYGRPNLLDFTKLPRRVLWCFGFYAGEDMKKHFLHTTIRLVSIAAITPFPILILTKIILDKQDLSAIVERHNILLQFWIVIKVFLYVRRYPSLRLLEERLRDDIFNSHSVEQDKYLWRAMRKQTGFCKLLLSSTATFTSLFAIFLPSDKKSLNIPIWTPIELNRAAWHAYEVFCYIITASVYPSIDCVVTGLLVNMTGQMQILRDNLEGVIERDGREEYSIQEVRIRRRLKTCILHHNSIFEFVSETERIFSYSLFCQILFSVLGICLTGIQFLLVTGSSRFAQIIAYLIVMLFQIYFICWFVEDLIEESSNVIQSCYSSEWYTCSTSTKKLFFVMMERAKKPITFSAGYFFTLSLATFVMILRNSYTYFAVLRQVYRK